MDHASMITTLCKWAMQAWYRHDFMSLDIQSKDILQLSKYMPSKPLENNSISLSVHVNGAALFAIIGLSLFSAFISLFACCFLVQVWWSFIYCFELDFILTIL